MQSLHLANRTTKAQPRKMHRVKTSLRSNLQTRIISAIALGVPFLILSYLGGWWFTAVILIAVLICAYEFHRLMQSAGYHPNLLVNVTALLAVFVGLRLPNLPILAPAFSLVLLGSLAWQLRHTQQGSVADWALSFAGGLYLGWTGEHLAGVRELNQGLWWLILTLTATWLADSGAFFVGRRLGRHKLAPTISPSKTWEGYLGGIVFGTLGGALIGAISPIGIPVAVAGGLLVSAFSTLGDLAESMFKRQANAKNSGTLIPGHGGVFDRIDSLLWSGVLIYYLAFYLGPVVALP